MTKIMLVEDDKSLREIYGVRLLAEGYDIVSAGDGELALAMAIKERPQLIISDVMMPKISGFDMLDILRSTTETRDIKVIMMTALSSDEQRARGEQLGADRYLVKSQVGIEDVVRVVHEVLGDAPTNSPAATTPTQQQAVPQRTAPPAASAVPAPAPQPEPAASSIPKPTAPFSSPRPASLGERVIQPLKDNPRNQNVDINQLLDREMAKETSVPSLPIADTQTTNESTLPQSQEQQSAAAPEPVAPQPPTGELLDATAQFAAQQQPQAEAQAQTPQPTSIQDIAPAPPIEPQPQEQPQVPIATPQPAQQPQQHTQPQQDISTQLDQLIAQDTANRQESEPQPATPEYQAPAAQQQYAPQPPTAPQSQVPQQEHYAQRPQIPPRPQR